ncbi:MAG: hypothetical protein PHP35_03060, partial [Candidatus Colwellbacteria bacterium]|nr:hypothetical protein [Candidatus Colwellbacteria bacterium]
GINVKWTTGGLDSSSKVEIQLCLPAGGCGKIAESTAGAGSYKIVVPNPSAGPDSLLVFVKLISKDPSGKQVTGQSNSFYLTNK